MTTYKEIKGQLIRKVSSDPTNPLEGQIWYNSTTGILKGLPALGAWVSASPVITARRTAASVGTQTANFIAGGFIPGFVASTEEYNGSGWAAGGDMPASSYSAFGAGTLTAGLVYGGSTDPSGQEGITTTLEYDGSSWTSGGALNQKRWSSSSGAGTQTAALCSSGYNDGNVTNSEEYNGSTWTAGNAIDTAKRAHGQCGTQTASVLFGGIEPPGSRIATVEEYDGTNYSSATSLPGNRSDMGASGTQTAALGFAGYVDPGRSNNAFSYDGTSWTAQPNLATAIDGGGGSRGGTSTAALSSTGTAPPGLTSASEEFTQSANVITGAAWTSGGNLGTARYKISSANAAPQNAGLGFGGRAASGDTARDLSEEYNGASWSEGNNLNNATRGAVGAGTQTAGLRAGGFDGGPAEQDNTEEYDGTSWSNANDMPANMRLGAGCGTQTAGLAFGGLSSPLSNKAVEYDGTNWTVGGTMNTGRNYLAGFGVQTAAVAAGGNSKDNTEEYNGTSWTSVNDVTSGNTQGAAGGGILTAGLFFGGTRTSVPANTNIALNYDGTNWSTTASMATARVALGGTSGGSNTAGLAFGGNGPPQLNATEEFTGGTSALNIKTLTTS